MERVAAGTILLFMLLIVPPAGATVILGETAGPGLDNAIGGCNFGPDTFICRDARGESGAEARARPGDIGAGAHAFTHGLDGLPAVAGAAASYTDTAFVFSATDGTHTSGFVPTAAILDLHGSIGASNLGGAEVDFFVVAVDGHPRFHLRVPDPGNAHYINEFAGPIVVFEDAIDARIKTPMIEVPLDTPVSFMMALSASAFAPGVGGGSSAASGFGTSLKFPTGIDVFDLPPGFTVNAPDSFIFDNRYFPGDTPPPGAVPEPGTLILLMLGVIALALTADPGAPRTVSRGALPTASVGSTPKGSSARWEVGSAVTRAEVLE
jgi:hypothetical protein